LQVIRNLFARLCTTITPIYFGVFFFLTPLLAGATGGLGRNLLAFTEKRVNSPGHTFE
jgi:hypothetical protein